MCTPGFSSAKFNPAGRLLGDKFKIVDPLMAHAEKQEAKWFAAPQAPKPPPALQAPKDPGTDALRRRKPFSNATLLTGPQGVAAGALSTGAPTLLGG